MWNEKRVRVDMGQVIQTGRKVMAAGEWMEKPSLESS